ncbi:MAG TPA: histidine triad nucleotide-binding protein [Aggregatilineales bacterium]|nr:histidine triad nucleotide-binding protein [Aggregatilineales bacterium]
MADDCVFCKIIQGELPSKKAFENDELVAIHDINAAAPTHILIIPRQHIASLNDATEKDTPLLGHMLQTAIHVAREQKLDARGYRLVVNTGHEAGQAVAHVHLHLLGGRYMSWPPG